MFIPRKILEEKLRQILAEDIGQGDVTAQAIIPPNLTVQAIVIAKEDGIAAEYVINPDAGCYLCYLRVPLYVLFHLT